ncbi:hypothetical protein RIF29_20061 [Crotalaria pallida]|uniref:Uncharacterized protein n=1 Tax=Crotalaria pallida TaxID=3830 RepID=A0AAN9F0J8_CROPI
MCKIRSCHVEAMPPSSVNLNANESGNFSHGKKLHASNLASGIKAESFSPLLNHAAPPSVRKVASSLLQFFDTSSSALHFFFSHRHTPRRHTPHRHRHRHRHDPASQRQGQDSDRDQPPPPPGSAAPHLGAESLRLLAAAVHELPAEDAVRESEEVLNVVVCDVAVGVAGRWLGHCRCRW